jgi:hypothetical protein
MLQFLHGVNTPQYSNKGSEGLGFDHFYMSSPCNFLIKDYTEIFYAIYKWNISSI